MDIFEKKDFFISRAGKDKEWAKWIAGTLEENGYTTILQDWDFKTADNFIVKMHNAINKSNYMVAIMSKNYFKSAACNEEWSSMFAKQLRKKKTFIIPVKIDNNQHGGLLDNKLYIDLFGVEENEAEKRLLDGVSFVNLDDSDGSDRKKPIFPGSEKIIKTRFPGVLSPDTTFYKKKEFL